MKIKVEHPSQRVDVDFITINGMIDGEPIILINTNGRTEIEFTYKEFNKMYKKFKEIHQYYKENYI